MWKPEAGKGSQGEDKDGQSVNVKDEEIEIDRDVDR
jgi:hypothetical protein